MGSSIRKRGTCPPGSCGCACKGRRTGSRSPDEIYGAPLPSTYAVDQLRRIPLAEVLTFCARTLNLIHRPGVSRRELDLVVAGVWYPARALVVPQTLMLVARSAFEHSPTSLPADEGRGDIVGALMAVTQEIGGDVELGQTVVDDAPGPLGREMIANQLFHQTWGPANLAARHYRRWRQLAAELADDPQVVDLNAMYERATGVSLDDLVAVGAFLWLCAGQIDCRIPREHLYRLRLPRQRIDKVLDLISADLGTVAAELRRQDRERRTEWSFDAFQQWPVLQVDDEHLLVLDARLVANRIFGWLPIFDIKFPPPSVAKMPRKEAEKAEHCLRHVTEIYACEVLRSITGEATGARRVFEDADLHAAFRRPGQRIADAAIDYGDAWLVAEVTTTQLRREAATGVADDSQVQDIDKLVDELDQIDQTCRALRADESALTGSEPQVHWRFLPLLVLPEGFPVNPVTLTVIRKRAQDRGLLTDADVDPIEVVDIEDLEMVESLQEHGGASLLGLLRDKQSSTMANASLRDYISFCVTGGLSAPQRLRGAFLAALAPMQQALPEQ